MKKRLTPHGSFVSGCAGGFVRGVDIIDLYGHVDARHLDARIAA